MSLTFYDCQSKDSPAFGGVFTIRMDRQPSDLLFELQYPGEERQHILADPFSYLIGMVAVITFHGGRDACRTELLAVILGPFRDPGVFIVDAVIHRNAFQLEQIVLILYRFLRNAAEAAFP